MPLPNKTVAAVLLNAAKILEGSSYRQVASAVRHALKDVKGPQGNRNKTVLAIVNVLGENPTLMNAIVEMAAEYGKPDQRLIVDWLGQPLLEWREKWNIDDDGEYDDLSRDVAKMLITVSRDWKHTGTSEAPPIDYADAYLELQIIERPLERLKKGRSGWSQEEDLQEVLQGVKNLATALGLKVVE